LLISVIFALQMDFILLFPNNGTDARNYRVGSYTTLILGNPKLVEHKSCLS